MAESSYGPCFPLEALQAVSVGRERRGQDLDGDDPIEASVAGAIHFTHPASAQRRLNFIGTESCAGIEGHGWAQL
jgi:hypothetical protein